MGVKKVKRPTPHKDWDLRRGAEKQRGYLKEHEEKYRATEREVTAAELTPDGTVLCSFTINAKPVTKKTHSQAVFRKGPARVLPSPQYAYFEKCAERDCREAWELQGYPPMDFGVAVIIRVFTETWQVGDHAGYLQAVGDVLQFWGVLLDDKFIQWQQRPGEHWFGGKDPDNARFEIEVQRMRHPYEEYRAQNTAKTVKKGAKNGLSTLDAALTELSTPE
ncbi:MAG: hypothetical protein JSS66_05390 [Armatimonadetes bacterium]|nr:hypothetical protein [Armatimonadota bacterium]